MTLELIDTHCHLTLEPLADALESVLTRARQAGVRQCVTVAIDLASSRANLTLARQHGMLYAAVGVHPHEADTVTEAVVQDVDQLARDPHVVAIGEVGLDYYRKHASAEGQQRALRWFVGVGQRRGLPVIIHCRDAYEDLLRILREFAGPSLRGVIHCASGPPAFIEGVLALGLYVSFAGNVTFPNATALRELLPLVPDDRLLVETDAPYLAPQPVRGTPNEPAYLTHTIAEMAKQRGTPVEQLGALTSENARRLFGLDDRKPS